MNFKEATKYAQWGAVMIYRPSGNAVLALYRPVPPLNEAIGPEAFRKICLSGILAELHMENGKIVVRDYIPTDEDEAATDWERVDHNKNMPAHMAWVLL